MRHARWVRPWLLFAVVRVVDPQGVIRHEVQYGAAQVQPGVTVTFP